ncbi:MAG: hypothetical protein ACOYIQ_01620 [Christensenellales bacterium]|jgi:hypothetical protein
MKKPAFYNSALGKIIVWALVILLLLSSVILIGIYYFYPFPENNEEPIPDPGEGPLVYGQEVLQGFHNSLQVFLQNALFLNRANAEQLVRFFLTAFSRARVPGEKVLAFGQYLAVHWKEADTYLERVIGYLEEDGSGIKVREGVDIYTFYGEIAIISVALINMLDACGFSRGEIGATLFEFLYQIPDAEYHAALLSLSKQGFITLYDSIYAVLAVANADFSAGYTPEGLRRMRSGMYQIGGNYINLYNDPGSETIEGVFGVRFLVLPEDVGEIEEEQLAAYNDAIASLDGLIGFSLLFFSEFCVRATDELYENAAEYAQNKEEDRLIISALQAARSARSALDSCYANSKNTVIKNDAQLVSAYALMYEKFGSLTGAGGGDYSSDLQEYLDILFSLAGDEYKDIDTLAKAGNLDEDTKGALLGKIEQLSEIDEETKAFPAKVAGVLIFNIAFKVLDVKGFLEELAQNAAGGMV